MSVLPIFFWLVGKKKHNTQTQQSGPQTFWEQWDAFAHAINWMEPFILSLLLFHVVVLGCTIWVSRPNFSLTPRIVLMVCIAGLVRFAETMNHWLNKNWQSLNITQNYFDSRGYFISIFLCAPLLFDSFIMLICFLREASQLLVQVKTAELKQKRKKKQGGGSGSGGGTGAASTAGNSNATDKNKSSGGGGSSSGQRRGKKDQ